MWIAIEDVPGSCSIITKADTAGGFEVSNLCSIEVVTVKLHSDQCKKLVQYRSYILLCSDRIDISESQNFKYNKF